MRIKEKLALLILPVMILTLNACGVFSGTKIEFSFSTSSPADSTDEKIIYINDDIDKLVLNAELKIDSGYVEIQVINSESDEVAWYGDYYEDENFKIEINDLKAESEYIVNVSAVQSKNVNLSITSESKLVKDKETPDKPEKYII